jgi:hypothetical protein
LQHPPEALTLLVTLVERCQDRANMSLMLPEAWHILIEADQLKPVPCHVSEQGRFNGHNAIV